jgi:hypothetical protein
MGLIWNVAQSHDERHDDDNRRKNVHHPADDYEKGVQAEQEHPLRFNVRLVQSMRRAGTWASIKYVVNPTATARITRMPPTVRSSDSLRVADR